MQSCYSTVLYTSTKIGAPDAIIYYCVDCVVYEYHSTTAVGAADALTYYCVDCEHHSSTAVGAADAIML